MNHKYTRDVEINLDLREDGNLYINYCDAQVAQWTESMGLLVDYMKPSDLAYYIAEAIQENAEGLAGTLVEDLYERVLKDAS